MEDASDDVALLASWASGDQKAGARLFDRHFAPVSRFFSNKAADAADDLIQKTFLGCVEGRERFRADSSFRTYLFGIARNVLHNHYRARRRGAERADFSVASIAALLPSASTMLAIRGEHRVLLEALRNVPVDAQVLLELVYWERLKAREVAEIIGVPEGTVRTRLRQAKTVLAAEMIRLEGSGAPLESTLHQLDDWAAKVRREAFG